VASFAWGAMSDTASSGTANATPRGSVGEDLEEYELEAQAVIDRRKARDAVRKADIAAKAERVAVRMADSERHDAAVIADADAFIALLGALSDIVRMPTPADTLGALSDIVRMPTPAPSDIVGMPTPANTIGALSDIVRMPTPADSFGSLSVISGATVNSFPRSDNNCGLVRPGDHRISASSYPEVVPRGAPVDSSPRFDEGRGLVRLGERPLPERAAVDASADPLLHPEAALSGATVNFFPRSDKDRGP